VVFLLGVASLMFDKAWDSLASWLIETDEEQEPIERVVLRNGNYYYINSETDENIWLGRYVTEPSGHDWKEVTKTFVKTFVPVAIRVPCGGPCAHDNCQGRIVGWEKPQEVELVSSEYFEWSWRLEDGMNAWEGRDISLIFPNRWICNTCFIEKHEWHNHEIVNGKAIPVKVCRDCQ